MNHLDDVGRYAPSSLDVSRAAARRHEHSAALRDRRAGGSGGRLPLLHRLRLLVRREPRLPVATVTEPAGAAEQVRPHEGRDEARREHVRAAA